MNPETAKDFNIEESEHIRKSPIWLTNVWMKLGNKHVVELKEGQTFLKCGLTSQVKINKLAASISNHDKVQELEDHSKLFILIRGINTTSLERVNISNSLEKPSFQRKECDGEEW